MSPEKASEWRIALHDHGGSISPVEPIYQENAARTLLLQIADSVHRSGVNQALITFSSDFSPDDAKRLAIVSSLVESLNKIQRGVQYEASFAPRVEWNDPLSIIVNLK